MTVLEPIDLFNGLNMNPVPLEFSQSLTTSEWLCAMQAKINEVVKAVNNIENEAEKYTDEQIEQLKAYIEELNKTLSGVIGACKIECFEHSDLNKQYAINEMTNKLEEVRNELILKIEGDDSIIIEDVQKKYEYLLSIIRKYSLQIVNPTTGQYSTVQEALNDIYNMLRNEAMTVEEFEAVGLTCEEYDALDLACQLFDMYAKQYVKKS